MRSALLAFCLSAVLSGCGPKLAQQQLVLADAQATVSSANDVITDYGIAKGLALVAEGGLTLAGQPGLAASLTGLVAASDVLVGKLQAAVTTDALDLANIQSLVASINAKTQAIRLQAAPAITVVANPPVVAAH